MVEVNRDVLIDIRTPLSYTRSRDRDKNVTNFGGDLRASTGKGGPIHAKKRLYFNLLISWS